MIVFRLGQGVHQSPCFNSALSHQKCKRLFKYISLSELARVATQSGCVVGTRNRATLTSSMTDNDPPEQKPLGPTPADVPLDRLPTVELTDDQLQDARRIAEARNGSYDRIDGGRVLGDQTSIDVHTIGVIGELVYATRYNDRIDDSVYSYGDSGHDFVSGSLTVDVKTSGTHIDRPALIVPTEPTPSADLYFLVHQIEEGTGRIIGFATHATVTDQNPVRRPGNDLNYIVEQEELWLPPDISEKTDSEVGTL